MAGYEDTLKLLRPLMFTRDTTAWDVLEKIKELAQEDPKRIRMNSFGYLRASGYDVPDYIKLPRCGAVGCISGWAAIVTGRVYETVCFDGLGLTRGQKGELYYPPWYLDGGQQTPEHAARVVRHIEKFQQKYEEQLKRTPVIVKDAK